MPNWQNKTFPVKNILLSRKFLIPTLLIGVIYLVSVVFLMNWRLVANTILEDYPLVYKLNLLVALLAGMWTAMTKSALLVLIATSFLTGANLTLIALKLKELKRFGSLQLLTSGGSVLGVVGSGCVACGLPVLSILGLGGSIIYLPFHGSELAYIAVGILAISFSILLKSNSSTVCATPQKRVNYQKMYAVK